MKMSTFRLSNRRLAPPTSHTSARSARSPHRVEVLRTLRAFAAHLLLVLQLWLGPVDGLPAVAAVTRPVAAIPVVAVNRSVLPREYVVFPDGNAGVGVGVVNESAAAGRS